MKVEAYYTILREWRAGGGLEKCLKGEDTPKFPLPPPERVPVWSAPPIVRVRWTAAEDAIMRDHYLAEGYGVLPKLPMRSKEAIRTRARILGVQGAINVNRT